MQQIQIPNKILNAVRQWKRFLAIHGGRGGAKSESIARIILKEASDNKHKILCAREYQNSIADSVKGLFENLIEQYKMPNFKILDKTIIHRITGTEFLFKGLKKETVSSIKSIPNISLAWVEEANTVSERSLELLTPTIRHPNSKIVFTYNLDNEDDPVHKRFALTERPDTIVCKVNYYDNPFFSEPLLSEMLYDKENDYERYLHVWEGLPIVHSEDQIFYGKWSVDDFEIPEDSVFFHGGDFGYSSDPTAAIRCFIKDDCLYIDRESYKHKLEITDTAKYVTNDIPTIHHGYSLWDNSRPETISHIKNIDGMNAHAAKKGQGSVIDGIQKIRGFKHIYIHSRCKETATEFRLYKWKRNASTGILLNDPEDKHNHLVDALRYALEKYSKREWTVHKW